MAADDRRRRGDTPEGAVRAARIQAGGVAQAMEALRDQRGLPWLDELARDLRYGFLLLRRSPVFAGAAVLSLGLGIGANTAVFSFADALLLRPLGVPRPDEVLAVGSRESFPPRLVSSYREYIDLRDRSNSFEGLLASTTVTAVFVPEPGALPRVRMGMAVSGNFFSVLGIEPALGRDFRPEEHEVPGRDAVVILGHDFWLQQFSGDRSVLGRTVRLGGFDWTIIGVAPAGFTGLDQYSRFEFYAPLMMWPRLLTDSRVDPLEARDFRTLTLKGRLAPGVSIGQAQTELSSIAKDWERTYPEPSRNRSLEVRTELSARIEQAPPVARLIVMLGLLAASVLFVACANVAGLLASRAPTRAREIALRMALGARRPRVIRQLITESALIASIGGVLALGVAYAGVRLFRQFRIPTELPIAASFELDSRALLVSLVVALVSVVLFGLAPAIRSARADLTTVMKATDASGFRRGRRWGRALLVGGQVAVAVVLLVVATFVYRGFQQRFESGPGFRTDHVLLMWFQPSLVQYGDEQAQRFFEQLAERARSVSGVRSAALSSSLPLDGRLSRSTIVPEGFQLPEGTEKVTVPSAVVGEGYFDTLELPILRGRGFHATDTADAPPVAVVNELFAQHYWSGRDPLGKRFRVDGVEGPWVTIVGVAKNSKYSFITEAPTEFVYFPYRQRPQPLMALLVESIGDPTALSTPLREMVRSIDANQPIYNIRTLEENYRLRAVVIYQVIIRLVAAMGVMGLALSLVGLYGLSAYAASRRTKEIGIRLAMGAGRSDVLRMVVQQGMALSVAGLGVGLLASVAASRALTSVFRGGAGGDHRTDPGAFLLVAATVLLVTLFAAYIPARRASRVDPGETLRHQ
jgi:putative ABC transport system permease protein